MSSSPPAPAAASKSAPASASPPAPAPIAPAAPAPTPAPASTPHPAAFDTVYPSALRSAEAAALDLRRRRATDPAAPDDAGTPPPTLPADTIGLALSGGGIRSATFCLGFLQRLAQARSGDQPGGARLLGRIDFLSTVSGGGYLGGFWGAWLNRLRTPATPDSAAAIGTDLDSAQEKLSQLHSAPVRWLRENGRYLTPGGAADARIAIAVVQRNLLVLHLLLALFAGTLLWALAGLRHFTTDPKGALHGILPRPGDAPWVMEDWSWRSEVVPWLWAPALAALALAVFFGAAYWLPPVLKEEKRRNFFARSLATWLAVAGLAALVAAVDLAGGVLSGMRLFEGWTVTSLFGPGVAAVTAAVAFTSRLRGALEKLQPASGAKDGDAGGGLPLTLIARLAAPLLAALWLVTLATGLDLSFATGARWLRTTWPLSPGNLLVLWAALLLVGVFASLVIGRLTCLLNDTSLAPLYAARLTRAYLGATNPARCAGTKPATELLPGDQVSFRDYFPHRAGGPLHLINCTLNQTIDDRSSLIQQDRKGMPFAIGPAGLTVGARHHALWGTAHATPATDGPRRDGTYTQVGGGVGDGSSGTNTSSRPQFHALASLPADGSQPAELPPLGRLVSISGAAVSTGLGRQTRPGVSLLVGLLNLRLGWWWDSGQPHRRRGSGPAAWLAKACPFYSHLLGELLGRFHGVGPRRWYLSDGGHFENTAAYELIRRRVRFIVILDNGCDATRVLGDFANLVRKARIDFNAEIEPLSQPELADLLPPALLDHIGPLASLALADGFDVADSRPAMLARVRYLDGASPDSLLLLAKPTVRPSAPPDVREYRATHRAFPQEGTGDQFFDEAQWESYRRLGWHLAGQLFDQPASVRTQLPAGWLLR